MSDHYLASKAIPKRSFLLKAVTPQSISSLIYFIEALGAVEISEQLNFQLTG
jgi:hypothetical protein